MIYRPTPFSDGQRRLLKLPPWVSSGRAESVGSVAFQSGAVLTVLDSLLRDQACGVPVRLLGNRLALRAATATSKLEGRLAGVAEIRDAFHLTPPGEARGPDGDLLAFWREVAGLRPTGRGAPDGIRHLIGATFAEAADDWLKAGDTRVRTHGPLTGCACILRAVLAADDRAERIACLLSDVVLARALSWDVVLPITAQRVTKAMLRDLVSGAPDADLAIETRLLKSVQEVIPLACDLAQRAAALRAIAPKLRAKGSDAAITLFLREDAVAPSLALSPLIQGSKAPMSDRAARRFCDRLVTLGVAQELTGRSVFRLYGIVP